MDAGALKAEVEDYLEGKRDIGLQVWRWLSLDSWTRHFIARDPRVRSGMPDVLPRHARGRSPLDAARENERALLMGFHSR